MHEGVTYLDRLPSANPQLSELPSYSTPPPGMGFEVPQPGPAYNPHRDNDYSKYIRNHARRGGMDQMSGMAMDMGPNVGGYVQTGPGGYHMPVQNSREYFAEASPATDSYDFDQKPAGDASKPATSAQEKKKTECSCREIYDHISGCNICKSFYMEGRNNAILYIIIVLLVLIIAFLTTKVYDIHLKR
jgi:hypothetical protein